MNNRVVVGIDGSPHSLAALDWAVADIRVRPRPLHLLYACGWPLVDLSLGPDSYRLPITFHAPDDVYAVAQKLLAEAAGRVDATLPITTEISTDLPGRALLTASRTAELLVIGSRGSGGFAGLLLGSVADQVTAHARCPVVTVRGESTVDGPVVVGVDGSPASQRALEFAFAYAAAHRVTVRAVHAWRWPASTGPGDMVPLVHDRDLFRAEEDRVLDDALAAVVADFPDVPVMRQVVAGRAAPTIIGASSGASLTVVGSRGRGGFTGLLLGSVSHQVLHHATGSVAVVHAS